MALSSAHGARASSIGERFRLIRELGSGPVPVWAALDAPSSARARLVIVQRMSRGGLHGDAEIDEWTRDARRLSALEHPNVARTREILVHGADTLVVSDFVDGVRWSELALHAQPPPLDVALRVLVDVLGGLWAIHNLRDTGRQPLRLVHGDMTPQNVVVGLDGISRVVGAHRFHTATSSAGSAASGYLAPEVLIADDAADARADVFSVGVMLWEALSGRVLFAKMQPSAIVTQILGGRLPRATLPENSAWAAPLVDIAARALSGEPENRFASTAAFATEVRRVAGAKLAQRTRVEALVRATSGDAIRVRREALERGEGAREISTVEPRAGRFPSVPVDVDFDDTAPTPVPEAPAKRPPPLPAPAVMVVPATVIAAPSPARVVPATVTAGPAPAKVVPATVTAGPAPAKVVPATVTAGPAPAMPARARAPGMAPAPAALTFAAAPAPVPHFPAPLPAAPPHSAKPAPSRAARPPALPRIAPAAPAVPRDLGFLDEGPIEPPEAIGLESAPPSAPPLASTSPDALPGRRRLRRTRAVVGIVVGCAALALPALLWWFGPHAREDVSTRRAPAASASASPAAPASAAMQATATATAPVPRDEPPVPQPDPTPVTAATPEPSAASAPATETAAPPDNPASPAAAPAFPAARPVARKKYEPEGI